MSDAVRGLRRTRVVFFGGIGPTFPAAVADARNQPNEGAETGLLPYFSRRTAERVLMHVKTVSPGQIEWSWAGKNLEIVAPGSDQTDLIRPTKGRYQLFAPGDWSEVPPVPRPGRMTPRRILKLLQAPMDDRRPLLAELARTPTSILKSAFAQAAAPERYLLIGILARKPERLASEVIATALGDPSLKVRTEAAYRMERRRSVP